MRTLRRISKSPWLELVYCIPIFFHAYVIAGIGTVVLGVRAYRWFAVKHNSNFFLWGTDTEISLISSSIGSSAAFVSTVALGLFPFVFAEGWATSTRLLLCAGSPFDTKVSWI